MPSEKFKETRDQVVGLGSICLLSAAGANCLNKRLFNDYSEEVTIKNSAKDNSSFVDNATQFSDVGFLLAAAIIMRYGSKNLFDRLSGTYEERNRKPQP